MGKLIHFVHQSLDGFIEGPDGEFDWPRMNPELSAYSQELSGGDKVFLYGRVVWDMMSNFWPKAEQHSTHEHTLVYAPIWRGRPRSWSPARWRGRLEHPGDRRERRRGADRAQGVRRHAAAVRRGPRPWPPTSRTTE